MDNREVAKEFIGFLIKLKKYMRAEVSKSRSSNITEQQFRTLMNLKQSGKCTLKELSGRIHVSNSSLCIMLNKMVEEGIVQREIDDKDRRNTFYNLSNCGRKFLEKELDKKLLTMGDKIGNLSEEEKEKFIVYLKGIEEIIEKIK
ncbi:DNA-binding MarR family transcriptional regulator [Clostridium tetanomorphum]|uniref:MarR family transcriptional regulator n=1 Tax=Clostridium tetanomorphum TaxID=1553 RepID=A0A923EDA5_CLOTT|nr:MarR family transcriptional regulator [Clostridium tetanomorphum]KAJ49974.1 MarR family transcriptional regulator [Clostridium tetanomorphum DSM 665]MBC2399301.1 MarR family transcriptional regulator [Clostridium tetanomorphum]MBP1866105.1 DNA-binding MarR family transcriptional regulator [Clostridium tetanomorphum]NRS86733.1 DNA-binding MarR family transcriptional regulator [Clostridium tetanomorphum]NRZ99514.1 DNA-binding MarR family transcriptional regulator [Clostridium tetanomorphum]